MKIKHATLSGKKQSGSVLILGLAMLMILSMLVISSAKTTVLQQKMTANLRDKELSFQSAESALKTGESFLLNKPKEDLAGDFSGNNGLFLFDINRSLSKESDWNGLGPIQAMDLHQVTNKPVFIIEELPVFEIEGDTLSIPRPVVSKFYRISSKSKGATSSSLSILQSMYKKK